MLADLPTKYTSVKVEMTKKNKLDYGKERFEFNRVEKELQQKNPKPVLWKKIATSDFGTGRNIRFGDLNNDGTIDLLTGQIVHHGIKDRNSELSCLTGITLKHYYIGHVQNPSVANFRDDLPGLEAVSINFWGNQGIIHYYDSNGNIYFSFEPNQFGSLCLPVSWTGRSEEFFLHNSNVDLGGMFDG